MSANFAEATIEWGANTITLLDLMKDILGITDNTQDVELSLYLQIAGEACEKYIDNKIAEQTVEERIAKAFDPVALRYWPAKTLSAVTVGGEDVTTEFELFTTDGIVWSVRDTCSGRVDTCFNQMKLSYTAGYEPIPTELGYAVVVAGIAYQSERGAVSGAVKRESVVGVGSVEYDVGDDTATGVGILPAGIIPVLDGYKRYHV
jgi:hypothetical protein